ncbi:MAG: hypothetical protein JNK05_38050 [Myxococcales bacterium]|nr:hypothetical protein [Myxococcales bacterium]
MLLTRQLWRLDDTLSMRHAVLRHERLVIAHSRTRGMGTMELGGGQSPRGRGWVWVVLEGEAYVEHQTNAHIVRRGETLVGTDATSRLVATSADVRLLQFVFEDGSETSLARSTRLDAATIARLVRCADAVDADGQLGPARQCAIEDAVDALGVRGLDVPLVRACAEVAPPPAVARLSEVVTALAATLSTHPGIDDLARALGLDERRASELAGAYFARYHPGFDGWRSYLATLRAELAWSLLPTGRRSSSDLARWLGYRTPTSMYHALERRGLSARARPLIEKPTRGAR